MDARPHRPIRGTRPQGDENLPLADLTNPIKQQVVHQRHKSMGNMLNHAPAKRSVLADVGNTSRVNTSRDDASIDSKKMYHDFIKPVAVPEKPAAFLRPAQRPLNAVPAKNSAAVPVDTISSSSNNNALTETQQPAQPVPELKRAASKRTIVFKDSSEASQKPVDLSAVNRPATSHVAYGQPTLSGANLAPVRQHLGARPQNAVPQSQVLHEQPPVRHTQSKVTGNQIEPSNIKLSESVSDVPRDVIPINQRNHVYDHYVQHVVKEEVVIAKDDRIHAVAPPAKSARPLPAQPIASEPEEYSEDEEYDEQGYMTAHSYRSRGDNTTGGATTVLYPKVTARVRRELEEAKLYVETTRTPEEVEDDLWDTSMVAEYGDEIFAYMRDLEVKMLPNAHYMDNQAEIQWSMRSVLMDWLIQVHHRFNLLPETLFLCVNYIDRFLSCKIVSLGKLQLVGATAIFVAAKYEEINCPSVNEIVYMVDGGYTVDEILKAERFMLSMLQFELGWPGPMSFLRRISKADDYDLETRTLAKYFLEVTIMDERFVGSPPSYIAAGAHCLARFMLKKGVWTPAHVYYSEYTWTQLRPLVSMMIECCENPQKHHSAVYDKYSDRRYKRASVFVQSEMDRGFTIPPTSSARPSLPTLESVAAQMPFVVHGQA